ncbi:hypothetical protein BDP81DRAFT_171608 [Colletotrichum phormii]|uniref:Uncharacterized protein n=1 Tax=Colletotrichum phormii TaxID=359342 RepID=A0AAI9ZCN7_9PEZI|nr:uncharacterized protein BDP81DRAFT_171608 [Colletotrichum phormii]KAK1621847.1 hypothetical protein BDP81DRAFT_171608 [Colletotrichum phormii]
MDAVREFSAQKSAYCSGSVVIFVRISNPAFCNTPANIAASNHQKHHQNTYKPGPPPPPNLAEHGQSRSTHNKLLHNQNHATHPHPSNLPLPHPKNLPNPPHHPQPHLHPALPLRHAPNIHLKTSLLKPRLALLLRRPHPPTPRLRTLPRRHLLRPLRRAPPNAAPSRPKSNSAYGASTRPPSSSSTCPCSTAPI